MDEPGYRPFPNQGHRNFLQRGLEVPLFIRALRLRPGCRMLEVGCGRGVALPVFESTLQPTVVVGLDIDADVLEEARRSAGPGSSARFVQGDVRHLPFSAGRFDLVVDFGTCYHITEPDTALAEIGRVLSRGGVFATESKLAQTLAHPFRTRGRRLDLPSYAPLRPFRHAGMWRSFRRVE